MTKNNLEVTAPKHFVSSSTLDRVAELAVSVDCDSSADRRPVLAELASEGLLDLGLPGAKGSYLDQTRVLSELAGACMTTAFSAWAHRMTVEYVAAFGGTAFDDLAESLRSAEVVGSTAMAATFRAASGQDELSVSLTEDTDGTLRANGFISWASNLYDDALIVTGMLHNNVRKIVAFHLNQPGVEVLPTTDLLALDASKSGAIRIENVEISSSQIFDVDFDAFVKSVRPVFLAFQTSFCVGLAAASLSAIHELSGVAVSLTEQLAERRAELARVSDQLEQLALWLETRDGAAPLNIVRLRLDAAHLATSATQLELAIRGGQAYSAKSPTARRVREALFLPVQSPTEAQLQWELQHSV
jgi:alkylation response protein AidB-like acyl-CoA dehydrogenase